MSDPKTVVDLGRMRRHYADFRAAWDQGAHEPAPRQSPTLMTIAAVLAAEDLGVLLDYLDAKERRSKGDPPPTYGQLETTVAALTAVVKQQGEIIRNLRHQCDGLLVENVALRTALGEKTEYVEQVALELAKLKAEEGICGDESPVRAHAANCSGTMPAICLLRHGHASEWHEDDMGHRWRHPRARVERLAADPSLVPVWPQLSLDPDVTRPYLPREGEEL